MKTTLIQIFHRPGSDDVNLAMLKELKKIRSQLRRAERRLTNKDGDDDDLSSDSDSEAKKKKLEAKPEDVKPVEVAPSPPPPESEALLGIFNEDPNDPPWIRDTELGDGEVSPATRIRRHFILY